MDVPEEIRELPGVIYGLIVLALAAIYARATAAE